MKCKHCQAELEEGSKVCPKCGEAVSEAQEIRENLIKVTPGKFAFTVAVCVVLLAVLVALVIGGMNVAKPETETTASSSVDPSLDVTEEPSQPATVPEDTGLNDVTCLGSYTAADADVTAAADTVVARVGDKTLTNGQLQVYYWMYVRQYLSSEMGYYASYIGLDYTQPLDTQTCYYDASLTWQQYFLQEALNSWYSYQAMALAAESAGHELAAEIKTDLESLPTMLEEAAVSQGFEGVDDMLHNYVGPAADLDDYMVYENLYYLGSDYFYAESEKMEPTEQEIDEYFQTYEEEYAANGLTKETKYVNVRHILVLPEGASIDTIYEETYSDEAWAAGETKAQEILKQWNNGGEEKFAALANEHSADPGSNTNGGLYTDVYEGQMMEAFDAWCFDPARKVGDTGIVKTAAGWHVMYYSGETLLWSETAKSDLLTERQNELMAEIMEKYPVEVDYTLIRLAEVGLA